MKNGMKLKAISAIVLGLALAGCGGGGGDDDDNANTGTSSTPQSGGVSSDSAEYLNQTSQTTESQAQQSQAVAQKSSNPAVRELAQQVNTEVTVINQQLTNISQTNNVTINNNLTTEQQTQINNLNNLSGEELNRVYVNNLVTSLKQLLASTIRQVREGQDAQVRQTAASNVLVIEQRLVIAQQVLFTLEPAQYLVAAHQANQLEIELANLALDRATNEQVRQFAQKMVDDHTQVTERITELASQQGVSLPTELSPEKQAILDSVSGFSEENFDKAYMDRNVLLHAESISMTSFVAQQGTDAEISAFAAEILPALQEHYQEAQAIATSIQASAFYQLAQSLVTELQLAQLAQTRSANDDQGRNLGQTIAQQNKASFSQIAQLARQQNAKIPLVVAPNQVQALLPLLTPAGADSEQIRSLITSQLTQSLQIAQSLQASSEAGVSNVAQVRIEALQSLNAEAEQGSSDGSSQGSGNGAATSQNDDAGSDTPGLGSSDGETIDSEDGNGSEGGATLTDDQTV